MVLLAMLSIKTSGDKTQCKVYDTDKNRSLNSLGDVINQEFIFVCLPTPNEIWW